VLLRAAGSPPFGFLPVFFLGWVELPPPSMFFTFPNFWAMCLSIALASGSFFGNFF
jgi:hypothetical protein